MALLVTQGSYEKQKDSDDVFRRRKPLTKTVWILLDHGADVTTGDSAHFTLLHLASSKGYFEIVRLLIRHGADVNALDDTLSTPLHQASWVSDDISRLSL
jgi:ankyrin repeat protein